MTLKTLGSKKAEKQQVQADTKQEEVKKSGKIRRFIFILAR